MFGNRKSHARTQLRLESLCQRALPSATVNFDAVNRIVTIEGDAKSNVARVEIANGRLSINADGAMQSFNLNQVRNLVFLGNAGNDEFVNLTSIRSIVVGGDGDDLLIGGSGRDDIFGGAGNDSIFGMAGDDRLTGNDGDDLIQGGEGDDRLRGMAGDDTLLGDAGKDELRGGAGADTLDGGDGADRIRANPGEDKILNLEAIDRLDPDRIWPEHPNGDDHGHGGHGADDGPNHNMTEHGPENENEQEAEHQNYY